jgi:DNA-binding transcriptional MerR regulator
MYSIGELSKRTSVSRESIRYYERVSLLPLPQRSDNGYRKYDQFDVERLQFVRHSRVLGFSIDEIREILAVREQERPPCQHVIKAIQKRIVEIETHIHDLERLRSDLNSLHEAGKHMPEDVQMKNCVCSLIRAKDEVNF